MLHTPAHNISKAAVTSSTRTTIRIMVMTRCTHACTQARTRAPVNVYLNISSLRLGVPNWCRCFVVFRPRRYVLSDDCIFLDAFARKHTHRNVNHNYKNLCRMCKCMREHLRFIIVASAERASRADWLYTHCLRITHICGVIFSDLEVLFTQRTKVSLNAFDAIGIWCLLDVIIRRFNHVEHAHYTKHSTK